MHFPYNSQVLSWQREAWNVKRIHGMLLTHKRTKEAVKNAFWLALEVGASTCRKSPASGTQEQERYGVQPIGILIE